MEPSWISIVPPLVAVVLAFLTREVVISLASACLVGVLLMGQGPQGFTALITRALGREDFIWICGIEVFIGVLVAFFQRSGAVAAFTGRVAQWARTRRRVGLVGWGLGLFIFFSDYFSPIFVGPVMRDLTDRFRISREKLAYICDSTSAPMVVLMPFSGWAVYLCGLVVSSSDIATLDEAMGLFMHSIPFNFYGLLAIAMVGLIAANLLPDYGPMRTAEERARTTGKVLRDGAVPMMARELTELEASTTGRRSLLVTFLVPVLIIIGTNVGTFSILGKAMVFESFVLAAVYLGLAMWLQGIDKLPEVMSTAMAGIKGVTPAVIILALAYCINALTREMHMAEYVVSVVRPYLSSGLLPSLAFIASGLIAFATGTSWGTYAIMVPIAMPLALQLCGGDSTATLVCATFAAVAGGGVFGDHCSPLSDTTVLSSLGSACDHIDHVRTQLPYTLTVAAVTSALYLIIGFV